MASVAPRTWTHNGVEKRAWVVRYFDETGARRSKQFALKKLADAYERKVEREIEDGTHTEAVDSRTIAAVAEEYERNCNERLRDGRIGTSHLIRETRVLRKHVVPALGATVFRDLKAADVERLYQGMLAKDLSPTTAKSYLYTFQYMESFARKRGYLKTQPVTDALKELRGIKRGRIRTFSVDEVRQLLAEANTVRPMVSFRAQAQLACMVHLAALCGLRQGEILGLTAENVDFDRGVLLIRHNLALGDVLKGPKTSAGVRDVPLPDRAAAQLKAWIASYYIDNPRKLIFRTRTGAAVDAGNLHAPWKALLVRAGIPHSNFHALRHFHASWLVNHGMPITDVAKLLGHSHFDMTLQVYAHPVMETGERDRRLAHIDRILANPIDATETQHALSA
jgi:integrase